MSSLGYLQEIAQVLKGADYYDVFSDVLLDRVSTLTSVHDLVKKDVMLELRRICSSSEYAYLYLQDFVLAVENKLKQNPMYAVKQHEAEYLIGNLARYLQETERTIIWDKYRGKDDEIAGSLDSRGVNALKLTPFYAKLSFKGAVKANDLKNEIFKIMKDNCAYQVMVQRVCGIYCPDSAKDDSLKLLAWEKFDNILLPVDILRHHQVHDVCDNDSL